MGTRDTLHALVHVRVQIPNSRSIYGRQRTGIKRHRVRAVSPRGVAASCGIRGFYHVHCCVTSRQDYCLQQFDSTTRYRENRFWPLLVPDLEICCRTIHVDWRPHVVNPRDFDGNIEGNNIICQHIFDTLVYLVREATSIQARPCVWSVGGNSLPSLPRNYWINVEMRLLDLFKANSSIRLA